MKAFRLVIAGLIGALLICLPVGVRAAEQDTETNFCQRLSGISTRIENSLAKVKAGEERNNNLFAQGNKSLKSELSQRRQQAERRQKQDLDKLKARAQNNQQREAILVYQSTIEAANLERQKAFDHAISEFEAGLTVLMGEKWTERINIGGQFSTDIKSALNEAKLACQSNVDPEQVRSELKQDISEARDKLATNRQQLVVIQPQVEKLVVVRQNQLQTALDIFKQAIETARTKLTSSFSNL